MKLSQGTGWGRHQTGLLFLLLFLLVGAGCAQADGEQATLPAAPPPPAGPTNTPFVLPTLYPTGTRPVARRTATPPRAATATSGPTVDLGQNLVSFHYTVPALELDRRLEGDVSGTITVVDETTGLAAILRNQGGVLLELQQALPELELATAADDCLRCVHFAYSLPLDGLEEEGWLQDPVMLASVENYLTTTLGPHFPPETVIGLHRRATAYDPAHSLALTAGGELWRWLATSGEIARAESAAGIGEALRAAMQDVPLLLVAEEYAVDCPGTSLEKLWLNPALTAAGAETETATPRPAGDGVMVTIACPAFSLPTTLLPLYVGLDALLEETVAEIGLPSPPPAIPLDTLLAYDRRDGAGLLLLQNGTARAVNAAGEVFTQTLALGDVLSLTVGLQDNEGLQPGVAGYAEGVSPFSLLVRGREGMLEAVWAAAPSEPLARPVERLDLLLEELTGIEPAATGTITATVTLTPTETVTP